MGDLSISSPQVCKKMDNYQKMDKVRQDLESKVVGRRKVSLC